MSKQGGWPPTGFGGRLRSLREQAALSQRELADKAGCNQFTVAKLERGLQEPAWPLVLALAKALDVTCEAFNGEAAGEPQEPRSPGRPPGKKADAVQAEKSCGQGDTARASAGDRDAVLLLLQQRGAPMSEEDVAAELGMDSARAADALDALYQSTKVNRDRRRRYIAVEGEKKPRKRKGER